MKFKVGLLNHKEQSKKDDEDIANKMNDDRRHIVEATIVRIMKARKTSGHNELLQETMKILSEIF